MTQSEVINKISMEAAAQLQKIINLKNPEPTILITDPECLNAIKWFIRQALVIGIDHFTKDMEEVIQMDHFGVEIARFKGVTDASRCKTGRYICSINGSAA